VPWVVMTCVESKGLDFSDLQVCFRILPWYSVILSISCRNYERAESHETLQFLSDNLNLLYAVCISTLLSSFAWTALLSLLLPFT